MFVACDILPVDTLVFVLTVPLLPLLALILWLRMRDRRGDMVDEDVFSL